MSGTASQPAWPDYLPKPPNAGRAGPVSLRGSPAARFGCLLGFAIIWNAIVGTIAFVAIAQGAGSGFDICGLLFLSVFVLIGLVLLAAAGWNFLALFNPRLTLQLPTACLLPGQTIDIDWSLSGRTSRLTRLQFTLEAREEATYRRGTDSVTDKSTFLKVPLADLQAGQNLDHGRLQVTVPPGLIHSLNLPNNKIVYLLHVHGTIPRWPDINEEFTLVVLPSGTPPGTAVA